MIKFREKNRTNSITDKIIAKYLGGGGTICIIKLPKNFSQ